MLSKPCCRQSCCFVVPFVDQRECRLGIILTGPRIFGMGNEHQLNFRSPAALAPNVSACPLKL